MKKILYIAITLIILIPKVTYAQTTTKSILEEQKSTFKIGNFVEEAGKYAPDFIKEMDIGSILESAISGKIDNAKFLEKILSLLGSNIKDTLKTLINILIIVLIHSLLKAFTDGLENNEVSKIVYYVQYILIVTVIMANFSEILSTITETVENMVGFTGVLIPLLATLMIFTGSITTTSIIEPILLFLIEFIANIIKGLIIPGVSIITVLVIISKITDKVQITKLTNFMKSSIAWLLGIILTIFIGVLSLEGTLTSSVDGITAKTTKAAVSNLIPVVRKSFGRWSRCNTRFRSCIKKCNWISWNTYNNRNMHCSNYKVRNIHHTIFRNIKYNRANC